MDFFNIIISDLDVAERDVDVLLRQKLLVDFADLEILEEQLRSVDWTKRQEHRNLGIHKER